MIIKGGAAGNVSFWSSHLLRVDTNERAEVKGIKGLLADTLPAALREMRAVAAGSRSQGNFMYQANLNPRADEKLTPEQWEKAIDTLERNMGLEGHQRVVVEHVKEGREHRHVIWNRVDVETMRVADIGGNYRTHEQTARQLETEFGLTPTPTPPVAERKAAPELWELRAAERSGIDPKALAEELKDLWAASDSGKAFMAAVEDRGYILAKGDRRDFVVIDLAGDTHSLPRRLGVKVAEVRERMGDLDPASLLSVADARAVMREVKFNERVAAYQEARELTAVEAKIMTADRQADSAGAFVAALYQDGITFARVDAAGIESLAAERRAIFATEDRTAYAPKLTEGELVAVNRFGGVHTLNAYKIDLDALDNALTAGNRDVAGLGAAREFIAEERAADQAAYEERNADFWAGYHERSEAREDRAALHGIDRQETQLAAANDNPSEGVEEAASASMAAAGKAAAVVLSFAADRIGDLIEFAASLLDGGDSRPKPTPAQAYRSRQESLAAMADILDSINNDRAVDAATVSKLSPNALQTIVNKGEVWLRQQADQEKDRERDRGGGLEL